MSVSVEKCLQAWTNSLKQMNAKADIVFFGDSLIYYGDFSSIFPDKVVCNLGLRGDTIKGMLDRIEQVKTLEPKKIYLMAGINDVAKYSQDKFENEYDSLIQQLKTQIPHASLIIQSMLPVNNIQYTISCNNDQIISLNCVIEKLSRKYNIEYIDLFSIYQKDMLLSPEITVDGIHLKADAYERWYNAL